MNITISVKQLGKKHPILQEKPIEIGTSKTKIFVNELLELVVEQQVKQFLSSASFEIDDEDKTHFPKDNYLPILIDTGKVGFGGIYNHKKPNVELAQQTALQAFEDGIYVIFYGEEQLEKLNQEIDLIEKKTITFVRLTFLAGSYW
jgi:TPP-dependent indolepyruvate ferredoxin oxidoreductase alpha subunit